MVSIWFLPSGRDTGDPVAASIGGVVDLLGAAGAVDVAVRAGDDAGGGVAHLLPGGVGVRVAERVVAELVLSVVLYGVDAGGGDGGGSDGPGGDGRDSDGPGGDGGGGGTDDHDIVNGSGGGHWFSGVSVPPVGGDCRNDVRCLGSGNAAGISPGGGMGIVGRAVVRDPGEVRRVMKRSRRGPGPGVRGPS